MSADDWAVCPRCLDRAEAARDSARSRSYSSAGAFPYASAAACTFAAQEPIDRDALTTFREDYEFHGAKDGTITAVYKGECQTCDLGVAFKHVVPFYERGRAL